jgi:hypothetical protein
MTGDQYQATPSSVFLFVSVFSSTSEKGTKFKTYSNAAKYSDFIYIYTNKTSSVILVRKRTIPTERPPLVGEV